MSQYLLDTNVLLRVAEPHSAQHVVAVEAVANLISQNQGIFLAPQVILEF
jgi:hypothetical protein